MFRIASEPRPHTAEMEEALVDPPLIWKDEELGGCGIRFL